MKTLVFLLFGLCFSLDVFGAFLNEKSNVQGASIIRFGFGMEVFSRVASSETIDLGSERNMEVKLPKQVAVFRQDSIVGLGFRFPNKTLNQITITRGHQDNSFDPSLIRYSINKPNLKFERDMKSFNDGSRNSFGSAYLLYSAARDLGFIHR